MLTTRTPSVRTAVAVLGAVSALLLTSACGGDDVSIKTPDGSVKLDKDGSEFSAEGANGEKVEGGTSLPDDFPDIPLVEGRILQGAKMSDGEQLGFTANIEVDGSVDAIAKDAADRLVAAGFASEGYQGSAGAVSMATFANEEWQVLLTVSESAEEGKAYANYTVAPVTP